MGGARCHDVPKLELAPGRVAFLEHVEPEVNGEELSRDGGGRRGRDYSRIPPNNTRAAEK